MKKHKTFLFFSSEKKRNICTFYEFCVFLSFIFERTHLKLAFLIIYIYLYIYIYIYI